MTTYMLDKETRELISKSEWWEKYGDKDRKRCGIMIINKSFDAYESPITGEVITTYRQREQEMKKHGCVDYEPTIRNDIDNKIKRDEAKLDKLVDETIDHEISQMDSRKRELMEQELNAGADITYERLGADDE